MIGATHSAECIFPIPFPTQYITLKQTAENALCIVKATVAMVKDSMQLGRFTFKPALLSQFTTLTKCHSPSWKPRYCNCRMAVTCIFP